MDIIQVHFLLTLSESNIPKICCLDVDENGINQRKEKVKYINVEHNEEDNEDNEKELELLVRVILCILLDNIL